MREVKFRAWDKEDNIMLESGFTELMDEYITSTGKVLEKQVDIGICYFDVYLVDISNKRILMQYTGLKDKNGKEIYEGDIVTGIRESHWHGGYDKVKAEVYFNNDHLSFRVNGLGGGFLHDVEEIEVIGNIYENPELLETK